jgi:uncharacterized repeat protein (TIGR01451 family)
MQIDWFVRLSAQLSTQISVILLTLSATLMSSVAFAQKAATAEPLKSTLVMSRVVMVNGKETLESAPNVKPGETLEYQATFTNVSSGSLKQILAVIPVPSNTEFVAGSETTGAQVSVDGVKYEAQPVKRKKRTANGAEVEEVVSTKEYRALRWSVAELNAGQSVSYKARVRVRDDRVSEVTKK